MKEQQPSQWRLKHSVLLSLLSMKSPKKRATDNNKITLYPIYFKITIFSIYCEITSIIPYILHFITLLYHCDAFNLPHLNKRFKKKTKKVIGNSKRMENST